LARSRLRTWDQLWGNNSGALGPADQNDVFAYNSSLQVSDTFTKVLNSHALKVGFT
jgi:hypothetical protein